MLLTIFFLIIITITLNWYCYSKSNSLITKSWQILFFAFFSFPSAMVFTSLYLEVPIRGDWEFSISESEFFQGFLYICLLTTIAQIVFLALPRNDTTLLMSKNDRIWLAKALWVSTVISAATATMQISAVGGITDFYLTSHWSERGADQGSYYSILNIIRTNVAMLGLTTVTILAASGRLKKEYVLLAFILTLALLFSGSGRKNFVVISVLWLVMVEAHTGKLQLIKWIILIFLMMQLLLLLRASSFDVSYLLNELHNYSLSDYVENFIMSSELVSGFSNWVALTGSRHVDIEYDFYISVFRLLGFSYDTLPGNARNVSVYFGDLLLPSIDYFTLFPGFILEAISYLGPVGVLINSICFTLVAHRINSVVQNSPAKAILVTGFTSIVMLQLMRGFLTYVIANFIFFTIIFFGIYLILQLIQKLKLR